MIQFYKPNPKVTGSACSFYLNRDGSLMASMLKQDSWNDQRKTGSFSKNKGRFFWKLEKNVSGPKKWPGQFLRSSKISKNLGF